MNILCDSTAVRFVWSARMVWVQNAKDTWSFKMHLIITRAVSCCKTATISQLVLCVFCLFDTVRLALISFIINYKLISFFFTPSISLLLISTAIAVVSFISICVFFSAPLSFAAVLFVCCFVIFCCCFR